MRRDPRSRLVRTPRPSALLLAAVALWACASAAQAQQLDTQAKFTLELTNGYRLDGLRWNIAADPSGTFTPNILSELTWSELQAYELGIAFRARLGSLVMPVSGSFAWILAGDNQDSDYDGDDRTLEFSRSNNQAGGYLLDAAVGLGYPFELLSGRLELTPLAGLDYHAQSLRMFDGYQTIPPDGPFPGLDSSYHGHWLGLHWAVELAFALTPRLSLDSALSAHAALYRAEADWNLRPDFEHPVSFAHRANGWGLIFSFDLDWRLNPRWSLGLGADARLWRTGPGLDETYWSNGAVSRTRLNEVLWSSAAIRLRSSLRL